MGWVDGVADGGEQRIAIDGFAEIAPGAEAQRARTVIGCVMARDRDDGNMHVGAGERRLYVEPADIGHMQIEHDASRCMVVDRSQKFGSGRERFHHEPRRSNEPGQRDAHICVVVHDRKQRRLGWHRATVRARVGA